MSLDLTAEELATLHPELAAEAHTIEQEARAKKWQPATGEELRKLRGLPKAKAEVLTDTAGHGLFYRGQVNLLSGDPSSGKSWILLEAVRQELTAGKKVLLLDCENIRENLVSRLEALGLPSKAYDLLTVLDTKELSKAFDHEAWDSLLLQKWALAVVDSFTAGLALLMKDGDSNSGDSIQRFMSARLQRLANTGAAVVVIDHKPKAAGGTKTRGSIGSERKLSMLQGAAYTAEVVLAPAPGTLGEIRLTLDKDNTGSVKERLAADREKYRLTQEAAVVEIDSRPKGDSAPATVITVKPARPLLEQKSEHLQESAETLAEILESSEAKQLIGRDSVAEALRAAGVRITTADLPAMLNLGTQLRLFRAEKSAQGRWTVTTL